MRGKVYLLFLIIGIDMSIWRWPEPLWMKLVLNESLIHKCKDSLYWVRVEPGMFYWLSDARHYQYYYRRVARNWLGVWIMQKEYFRSNSPMPGWENLRRYVAVLKRVIKSKSIKYQVWLGAFFEVAHEITDA